jgi:hypothetical protein
VCLAAVFATFVRDFFPQQIKTEIFTALLFSAARRLIKSENDETRNKSSAF